MRRFTLDTDMAVWWRTWNHLERTISLFEGVDRSDLLTFMQDETEAFG